MRFSLKARNALVTILVLAAAVPALAEEGTSLREADRRRSASAWGEASSAEPEQEPERRPEREPEAGDRPEGAPPPEPGGQGAEVRQGEPREGEDRRRRRRRPRRPRERLEEAGERDRRAPRRAGEAEAERGRGRHPERRRRLADPERERRVAGRRGEPEPEPRLERRRRPAGPERERRSEVPRRRGGRPEPVPAAPHPSEGTHWTVGARLGMVSVPAGLLHVFVDGGQGKTGVQAGAFFAYQRGLFEVSAGLFWADYRYSNDVIFQTAGDRNDPEFVRNELSLLVIGADFVWSHWFTRWLAATYGAGLGIGVVLGEVRRTEATPPTGPYAALDEPRTDGYVRCRYDPADPSWTTPFCEAMCSAAERAAGTCPPRRDPSESGDLVGFYDTRETRIPPVLPWVNVLLGVRLLPHPRFQVDLQAGFGVGFLFVSRLAYRF